MRRSFRSPAFALSICLLFAAPPEAARAGGTGLLYHDDRATFEEQFPGLPCESFEAGNVGPGGNLNCPSPLDSTSSNGCFSLGTIRPGVQFRNDAGANATLGEGGLALFGAGLEGSTSKQVFDAFADEAYEIVFGPPVRFVSLDLVSHYGGGAVSLQIFDAAETELEPGLARSGTPVGTFQGISTQEGFTIGRIRITGAAGQFVGADNVCFSPYPPIFGDDFERDDFVWSAAQGLAGDVGAFISSAALAGNFGGLAVADTTCQSLGTAAFPGSGPWAAWLSDAGSDARDRIPQPGPGRAYVRAREPFTVLADDLADLTDGTIDAVVGTTDENGNPLSPGAPWTGTLQDGTASASTCQNWTSTLAGGVTGNRFFTDARWTNEQSSACDQSLNLYCFGGLPPRNVGVFVSSQSFIGNFGGLAVADAACQTLGTTAMPGSGPWIAWLSSSTVDARDRIPKPGIGKAYVWPSNQGNVIANSLTDLTDGTLDSVVGGFDENGDPPPTFHTWTGTDADGTVAATCNDWTSSSNLVEGSQGNVGSSDSSWTQVGNGAACDQSAQLYCFGTLPPPAP